MRNPLLTRSWSSAMRMRSVTLDGARSLVSRAPPASHFPKPETAGKLAAFCLSSLMEPPFPARSAKTGGLVADGDGRANAEAAAGKRVRVEGTAE